MSVMEKIRGWYLNYGFIGIGLILVNLGLINWYLWARQARQQTVVVKTETRTEVVPDARQVTEESCDEECVEKLIEEKLATQGQVPPSPTPTPKVISGTVVPTPTPATREEYLALPNGETTGTLDWKSLNGGGKWLDTSLYGELVSASWSGWIEMPGGSGFGWARLYDATNGRAVDGSEMKITNTVRTSFYSGNISLWRGQNQYFIQVKSSGGGTVKVDGARIKLVVR